MDKATFDQWCLVELFGHARIAGRVSEETIGGCALVRVDVPTVDEIPGYTRLYGNGAIYSITPVTEEIARAAAKTYRTVPVSPYEIPELRALRNQAALSLSDDERGGF
jgi:hypothetical protein